MIKQFQSDNYINDEFDFVQCEAGNSHCLLLNALGQVFSFGEGMQGQLGLNE